MALEARLPAAAASRGARQRGSLPGIRNSCTLTSSRPQHLDATLPTRPEKPWAQGRVSVLRAFPCTRRSGSSRFFSCRSRSRRRRLALKTAAASASPSWTLTSRRALRALTRLNRPRRHGCAPHSSTIRPRRGGDRNRAPAPPPRRATAPSAPPRRGPAWSWARHGARCALVRRRLRATGVANGSRPRRIRGAASLAP